MPSFAVDRPVTEGVVHGAAIVQKFHCKRISRSRPPGRNPNKSANKLADRFPQKQVPSALDLSSRPQTHLPFGCSVAGVMWKPKISRNFRKKIFVSRPSPSLALRPQIFMSHRPRTSPCTNTAQAVPKSKVDAAEAAKSLLNLQGASQGSDQDIAAALHSDKAMQKAKEAAKDTDFQSSKHFVNVKEKPEADTPVPSVWGRAEAAGAAGHWGEAETGARTGAEQRRGTCVGV